MLDPGTFHDLIFRNIRAFLSAKHLSAKMFLLDVGKNSNFCMNHRINRTSSSRILVIVHSKTKTWLTFLDTMLPCNVPRIVHNASQLLRSIISSQAPKFYISLYIYSNNVFFQINQNIGLSKGPFPIQVYQIRSQSKVRFSPSIQVCLIALIKRSASRKQNGVDFPHVSTKENCCFNSIFKHEDPRRPTFLL